jgi:hypothetical protein
VLLAKITQAIPGSTSKDEVGILDYWTMLALFSGESLSGMNLSGSGQYFSSI